MSSYGNHVWTCERENIARRLVIAARNDDDIEFEQIMAGINCADMAAVAALLAEESIQLAIDHDGRSAAIDAAIMVLRDMPDDEDGYPITIELSELLVQMSVIGPFEPPNTAEGLINLLGDLIGDPLVDLVADVGDFTGYGALQFRWAGGPVVVDGVRMPQGMTPEVWAALTPEAQAALREIAAQQ
jgi:hypothetical protein